MSNLSIRFGFDTAMRNLRMTMTCAQAERLECVMSKHTLRQQLTIGLSLKRQVTTRAL